MHRPFAAAVLLSSCALTSCAEHQTGAEAPSPEGALAAEPAGESAQDEEDGDTSSDDGSAASTGAASSTGAALPPIKDWLPLSATTRFSLTWLHGCSHSEEQRSESGQIQLRVEADGTSWLELVVKSTSEASTRTGSGKNDFERNVYVSHSALRLNYRGKGTVSGDSFRAVFDVKEEVTGHADGTWGKANTSDEKLTIVCTPKRVDLTEVDEPDETDTSDEQPNEPADILTPTPMLSCVPPEPLSDLGRLLLVQGGIPFSPDGLFVDSFDGGGMDRTTVRRDD